MSALCLWLGTNRHQQTLVLRGTRATNNQSMRTWVVIHHVKEMGSHF
jgi:hypothetical protein